MMNAVSIIVISASSASAAALVMAVLLRPRKAPTNVVPISDYQAVVEFHGSPEELVSGKVVKVDGVVTYRDSARGYEWREHLLARTSSTVEQHWFTSEADGSYAYYEPGLVLPHDIRVGGETIQVEGVNYKLQRRGVAVYTSEGKTGMSKHGTCDYAIYHNGNRTLLLEQYANSGIWEVAHGQPLSLSEAA